MDGCMDGWMDAWMGGWMDMDDGCAFQLFARSRDRFMTVWLDEVVQLELASVLIEWPSNKHKLSFLLDVKL